MIDPDRYILGTVFGGSDEIMRHSLVRGESGVSGLRVFLLDLYNSEELPSSTIDSCNSLLISDLLSFSEVTSRL